MLFIKMVVHVCVCSSILILHVITIHKASQGKKKNVSVNMLLYKVIKSIKICTSLFILLRIPLFLKMYNCKLCKYQPKH